MQISIFGTGYVGLVTGTCFAEVGNHVVCVDVDAAKVARLKYGEVPIFEPGLAPMVQRNHKSGRLDFNTEAAPDFARIRDALKDPAIFDGRNLYDPVQVEAAELAYYGIGRGRALAEATKAVIAA